MDDKMCQCGHYESDHGADGSCGSSADTGYCPCFIFDDSDAQPDPRDAEIARLKAEVVNQRHEIGMLLAALAAYQRALAAGPAALRRVEVNLYPAQAAEIVERAQAAAMKEEP